MGTKLNIGSGTDIKEDGWINIDKYQYKGVNIVIDLEKESLLKRFKENSIDEIYSSHLLEHLINADGVFIDCLKLLKHKGIFELKLPHCSRIKTYSIFHKRFFNSESFSELYYDYSGSESLQSKNKIKVILKEKKLYWLHNPEDLMLKIINTIGNSIINSHPLIQNLVENYLVYYIGGLSEFYLKFKVIK